MVTPGAARLREAERPARVVLADNHCLLAWSKRSPFASCGIEPLRVGFWGPASQEELAADYALQLLAARDALARDLPVVVAGDGFGGKQGVDVPFFGHMRRFRSGAAALAVHTGAAVMPVFTTLQADGVIMHEVLPPLDRGGGSPATQTEHLTRQFAALYIARWPALLAILPWDQLDTLNRELGLARA